LSRPAGTPWITSPLALAGRQPRFAPANLKAWGCDGVELLRQEAALLSGPERDGLRQALSGANLATAFITSSDEAGQGWTPEALSEALAMARFFAAECVVTCAPARGSAGLSERQAAEWVHAAAALAQASAIPLLIENRPGTWADTGLGFDQFLGQAESPWLQVAFDPAGFVALREHPFLNAYMPSHLKTRLQLLRVRDAVFEDGRLVPVNDGNAELAELVSAVLARGFDGFFAVGAPEASLAEIGRALEEFKQLLALLGLENFAMKGETL
jgi:sugar phosphate isomerase/epimerase